jgi:hypothetical protein
MDAEKLAQENAQLRTQLADAEQKHAEVLRTHRKAEAKHHAARQQHAEALLEAKRLHTAHRQRVQTQQAMGLSLIDNVHQMAANFAERVDKMRKGYKRSQAHLAAAYEEEKRQHDALRAKLGLPPAQRNDPTWKTSDGEFCVGTSASSKRVRQKHGKSRGRRRRRSEAAQSSTGSSGRSKGASSPKRTQKQLDAKVVPTYQWHANFVDEEAIDEAWRKRIAALDAETAFMRTEFAQRRRTAALLKGTMALRRWARRNAKQPAPEGIRASHDHRLSAVETELRDCRRQIIDYANRYARPPPRGFDDAQRLVADFERWMEQKTAEA